MPQTTAGEPDRAAASRLPLLQIAVDLELERIDQMVVRVWQLLAAFGILTGLVVAVASSRVLGISSAVGAAVFLLWLLVVGRWLRHDAQSKKARLAMTFVEAALPWGFTLILIFTEGPMYAVASWVPPLLFAAVIISYTARLRPRESVLVGLVNGVAYPLLYVTLIQQQLPAAAENVVVYALPMQLTRGASLMLAGGLGALVAIGFRSIIGRAGVRVRQRDLFGKYRLDRVIASGGMGSVYDAVYCPEGGFERRVAVKRIHPHIAEQPKFVEGFRYEAQLGARLAHPNVVQVLDFGRVDDNYFLAMEYVDGTTLSAFMKRAELDGGEVPAHVVGYIAREILAGLAYAHQGVKGTDGRPLRVVHRDLCPQNVLLSKIGEVKITDFGIARMLRDSAAHQTDTLTGHVSYMAPEQARGLPVDTRSDLFAVGVMLWELLTGRRLFTRDNEAATLYALVNDDVVPVSIAVPGLEPSWDSVVQRALARDPELRFASASEMLAALELVAGSRDEASAEWLARSISSQPSIPDVETTTDEAETVALSRRSA